MNKLILWFGLLFASTLVKAHQVNVSTTMLAERENNTWVLQISASLTAFQQEIKTHFSETPYKTPEEFQQMVLKHIKNKLGIAFNGKPSSFGKGVVQLGHETKIILEVYGIPMDIHTLEVKNTVFQDIHKNTSAILILKKGFNKEHFVLDNSNNHTLKLYTEGTEFKNFYKDESDILSCYLDWILGGGIVLVIVFMGVSNIFKPEKIKLRLIK